MRRVLFFALLASAAACGKKKDGGGDDNGPPDACVGLQCNVSHDCSAMGMMDTSVSGTVFAPNGTLPLYEVNVYVPNADPGPFADGVQCSQCADGLPGSPVVTTATDEHGHFTLSGIPDGDNIPLIVTIGKWRRQLTLPHVDACEQVTLDAVDTTLPKSHTDITPNTKSVDLPKIAISTGGADALECLILKLGIDPTEISTAGQDGSIHLYADVGAGGGEGASKFKGGFGGGNGDFADSNTLWGDTNVAGDLSTYDIVILSCEGDQHPESKTQEGMDHLKAYADVGGRVFLSHWHNIWLEGDTRAHPGAPTKAPQDWPAIAHFTDSNDSLADGTIDTIDEVKNPKGTAFATWMLDPVVMGSATKDQVAIEDGTGKNTCDTLDDSKAERWINLDAANNNGGLSGPQMFQFTTPQDKEEGARCGKVVFSDMHVSGDSSSDPKTAYPNGCSTDGLTAQEKALAFMFFDISSCVGTIF